MICRANDPSVNHVAETPRKDPKVPKEPKDPVAPKPREPLRLKPSSLESQAPSLTIDFPESNMNFVGRYVLSLPSLPRMLL